MVPVMAGQKNHARFPARFCHDIAAQVSLSPATFERSLVVIGCISN